MRLWLGKAGVFISGWRVDEARFQQLIGTTIKEIEILSSLSPEQKAYLKTIANMGGSDSYLSNDIEKMASTTYGVKFNEKNLPKQILYPLREAGYIIIERGTKKEGRGAKPFIVTPTKKLVADFVVPMIEQLEKQTGSDLRPLLRRPLKNILEDLNSDNRYIAGLALEALAFKLMRFLDLSYVATRLRGAATGGAEVDLVFESSRLIYSRWQI